MEMARTTRLVAALIQVVRLGEQVSRLRLAPQRRE